MTDSISWQIERTDPKYSWLLRAESEILTKLEKHSQQWNEGLAQEIFVGPDAQDSQKQLIFSDLNQTTLDRAKANVPIASVKVCLWNRQKIGILYQVSENVQKALLARPDGHSLILYYQAKALGLLENCRPDSVMNPKVTRQLIQPGASDLEQYWQQLEQKNR